MSWPKERPNVFPTNSGVGVGVMLDVGLTTIIGLSEQCPGPVVPLLYASRVLTKELTELVETESVPTGGITLLPISTSAFVIAVCTFAGTEPPVAAFNFAAIS